VLLIQSASIGFLLFPELLITLYQYAWLPVKQNFRIFFRRTGGNPPAGKGIGGISPAKTAIIGELISKGVCVADWVFGTCPP